MACEVPRDPEIEKAFWNEARARLARGIDPADVIAQIAQKHGLGTDAVGSILQSKRMFMLTNEAWAKQAALGDLRRLSRQAAKAADLPQALKVIKGVYELPRQSLTIGHGGVIPFTHARDSLMIPGEQKIFAETVGQAYSYMTKEGGSARWNRDMVGLRSGQYGNFNFWKRAGLKIALQDQPVGMGMARWTRQSFDALKIMRIKLAEKYWKQLDPADRTFEGAQELAQKLNHATGVVDSPPVVNKIMGVASFSPQLRLTKYARVVDAFVSKFGAKRFAKLAAVNLGILAVNDMANRYIFNRPQDKINWTQPRADWLRAKVAGMTIPMSPMFETMRLPFAIAGDVMNPKTDNKWKTAEKEVASAAHPAINAIYGGITGKDLATGKTLPFKGASQYIYGEHRGEKPMFGKMVKNKYEQKMGKVEYAAGYAPIPGQPIIKAMAQEGIPPTTAAPYIEAILSGAAGTHAYPNVPYK